MKKIIPICLFLTGWFHVVSGQDYVPMAVEETHWVMLKDAADTPWHEACYEFLVRGDTLVDGKWYKKVYERWFYRDSTQFFCPFPHVTDFSMLIAAIRDDTLEKKVYAIQFPHPWSHAELTGCPTDEEFTLMDFSLEVGDTLQGLCVLGGMSFPITNIEEGDCYTGYSRKQFIVESGFGQPFCEGIGFAYTGSFIFPYPIATFLDHYCIGQDCENIVSTEEPASEKEELQAVPNPATHYLEIYFSGSVEQQRLLRITNNMGQARIEMDIPQGITRHTISVENWPPGIYFIQYLVEGVPVGIERVVVL